MAPKFSVLSDIDGVLHRASHPIPGARRFVKELQKSGRNYLFLTNSPDNSPSELRTQLAKFGMDIPASHFYTSAQAIATFIARHAKRPWIYLIGSPALRAELKTIGARFSDTRAEFIVVTTGGSYSRKELDKAIELVCKGGNLITANCEKAALSETGIKAGCGALVAPIEAATGCAAYVVGKPNHLMIRGAEEKFHIEPSESLMIGDSLDTDIDVGMQAQMKTILVLSGITSKMDLAKSAYKPDYVFPNVGHILLNRLP